MPNSLAHYGIQIVTTRLAIPAADLRWACIGCVIPDLPWIGQRIASSLPFWDALSIRIYCIIQASLFFCLMLCFFLTLFSRTPSRVMAILSINVFLHLLLDALQLKWANGVHFFAPVSWQMSGFQFVWPEHPLTYLLTAAGLVGIILVLLKYQTSPLFILPRTRPKQFAAILVFGCYLLLPLFFFYGPKGANNHYLATLIDKDGRPGQYVEVDRANFETKTRTLTLFTGEKINLRGSLPDHNTTLSIQGVFVEPDSIRVVNHHVHQKLRNYFNYIGLVLLLLLICISFQPAKKHHNR
ncbi:MAG: hypothetical protein D6B25_08560, partial [Desulfobulbaceae bacterium]